LGEDSGTSLERQRPVLSDFNDDAMRRPKDESHRIVTVFGSKEKEGMCERRGRCPDCDSGMLNGDGRCSHCHGSGTNLNFASDVPQCLFCKGTGVCQSCGGDGMIQMGEESGDGGIQKLFED